MNFSQFKHTKRGKRNKVSGQKPNAIIVQNMMFNDVDNDDEAKAILGKGVLGHLTLNLR